MFGNILGLLVLALLAALLGWLTRRSWGAKRGWVKWPGMVLAGLFTLIFALLTVAGTPEQIARGEHLASVLCAGCHSLNGEFPMTGGRNMSEETGLPLGDIFIRQTSRPPGTSLKCRMVNCSA